MKFSFKQFQFDCEQQILSENGNIVPLNDKATKLLVLFINNADKIHSKADILATVWTDTVVSDQVVFQNISQLRALFGSDAIKTFVKKGYQWQLPLVPVVDENLAAELNDETSKAEIEPQDDVYITPAEEQTLPTKVKRVFSSQLLFGILALVFTLAAVGLWYQSQSSPSQATEIPNAATNVVPKIHRVTYTSGELAIAPVEDTEANQNLFDSPYSLWQKLSTNDKEWLVSKRFYSIDEKVVLRFHIQGAHRGWQDYILASNNLDAEEQLRTLMHKLASTNYFSASSEYTALAELTLLVDKSPIAELITQQQIKQHILLNDLDRAAALIEQQLKANLSSLREGLLLLLKTQVAFNNRQWQQAEAIINQAIAIFERLSLVHLESRALIESSWIPLANQDFRKGIQILNSAVSKARLSGERLLEIDALITQSFMASKTKQMEMAYSLVDLAREIIELHQLGAEHHIPAINNLAWMSKSKAEKLEHYQNILNRSFNPQYENYFYVAVQRLRDNYIQSNDWHMAQSTILPWQRSSYQSISKAIIAFAQNDTIQGMADAQNAFQLAQVHYHKIDALNAALLLLQQNEALKDASKYRDFIKQNATPAWQDQNKEALNALELI